jgi:hypothetical protein
VAEAESDLQSIDKVISFGFPDVANPAEKVIKWLITIACPDPPIKNVSGTLIERIPGEGEGFSQIGLAVRMIVRGGKNYNKMKIFWKTVKTTSNLSDDNHEYLLLAMQAAAWIQNPETNTSVEEAEALYASSLLEAQTKKSSDKSSLEDARKIVSEVNETQKQEIKTPARNIIPEQFLHDLPKYQQIQPNQVSANTSGSMLINQRANLQDAYSKLL